MIFFILILIFTSTQDPKLIFDEVGEKSVGIIRHRHNTNLSVDGEYNVGTVYFRNSDLGIKTLKNWMECVILETRPDLATCGDQKYLELFELICGGPFNELCVYRQNNSTRRSVEF